jgi:hypothetical protein
MSEVAKEMCVRCIKRKVAVKQAPTGWVTAEGCPAGHGAGTPTGALIDLCMSCSQAEEEKIQIVKHEDGQEVQLNAPGQITGEAPPANAVTDAPPDPFRQLEDATTPPAPAAPPPAPPAATVAPPTAPAAAPLPTAAPLVVEQAAALPPATVPPPSPPQADGIPQAAAVAAPPVLTAATLGPQLAPAAAPTLPTATVPPPISQPALSEAPALMMQAAPPQQSDTAIGSISIGSLQDPESSSKVRIDDILSKMEGYIGGPSVGGFSSHILGDFQRCDRLWHLSYGLGYESVEEKAAMAFGSLGHACLALKYSRGLEFAQLPIQAAIQGGRAEMAHEAAALLQGAHECYGWEEYYTWCVRDVEKNVVCWTAPIKIGDETVRLPLSVRMDLILAVKEKDQPAPQLGPCPQGVYLVDHKFVGSMTRDLVEGYGNDFQFQFYTMVFHLAGLKQQYGELQGVKVNLLIRHKKITKDSFFRAGAQFSLDSTNEFYRTQAIPLATELWARLRNPAYNDTSMWPKKNTQCVGRYGLCEFFRVCSGDRSIDDTTCYRVNPDNIFSLDKLEPCPTQPTDGDITIPRKKSATDSANEAKAQEKEAKKASKKKFQDIIAKSIARMFAQQADTVADWAPIGRKVHLVPGHTEKSVKTQLPESLKAFTAPWVIGNVKFPIGIIDETGGQHPCELTAKKNGLAWALKDLGLDGTVTWKMLANEICEEVWFNPSQVLAR